MASRRPAETVADAVALLDVPDFQAACDAVFIEHAERILESGAGLPAAALLAFFDTWGVAPPRNDGLYRPADRDAGGALLGGGWGLIRVFPWTTDAEIRAAGRTIHAAIGKKHRGSVGREAKGARAAWLRRSGFTHAEIAAGLYGRAKDAKRPTKAQANKGRRLGRQDELVARYTAAGMPYRLAGRRALIAVRGTEGVGALAARQAARRADTAHHEVKAAIRAPRPVNALTDAVTTLLHARFVRPDARCTDEALMRLRAVLLDLPE